MKQFWIIVISCIVFGKFSKSEVVNLTFPEGFTLGTGSASYQVEGAWNVSDKGESSWDIYTHAHPERFANGSNGDITCNSYSNYKEDVQLIKSTGLDFYRFSISWTRVLPTGFTNVISKDGLQYYKNLTAELVANGIESVVTLYHWDHPQFLEEMGGWTNELMVDWFVSYARVIFDALCDNVQVWTTINEPDHLCAGYNGTAKAPGKLLNGIRIYLCMHNVLKAHAKTYRMYDEEFRPTQKGELGIVPHCYNYIAANDNDTVTAETAFEFNCGWMAHPIYFGDYPEIMKSRIAMISKAQGYENHDFQNFRMSGNLLSRFGDLLRTIKNKYDNPPVRIMENGYPDAGELNDYKRISYYHDTLKALLTAVNEDDCNVKSFGAWAVMDNFEWASAYTVKFGRFYVDFEDADRTRTAKLSSSWWKNVTETRELQPVPTDSDS